MEPQDTILGEGLWKTRAVRICYSLYYYLS